MTVHDLLLFYAGDAGAIRRLAADPWALAVGALLVLSAGLARNYDTQDLRRRWWRLLVPFAASTVAAGGLFLVTWLLTRGEAALPLARSLLGLFWLTAPFAWLYGLPFERLWAPDRAARARRLALAVVATCRVGLLARCIGVLLGYGWEDGLLIVAAFAAPTYCLAVAAALLLPWPRPTASEGWALAGVAGAARQVRDAMSGVPANPPLTLGVIPPAPPDREPPRDATPGCALGCLAVVGLVLSAYLLPLLIGPPRWPSPLAATTSPPPSPAVWAAAGLAVLFWVALAVRRQPAQRRRTEFERRLRSGDLPHALRDLAALGPEDFPPRWQPAAALDDGLFAPRLLEAARLAARLPAGSWVRAGFVRGLRQTLPVLADPIELWYSKDGRMTEPQLRDLSDLHDLLRDLPEAREVLDPYAEYLAALIGHIGERDPRRRAVLEGLLALGLKRGSKR